ncbi:MAG: hypothetical protein AB8B93_19630 [Pseudomonadales bacterium]
MAVNPIVSSGAAALERSRSQLDEAAHRVATGGTSRGASGDTAKVSPQQALTGTETPSGAPDQAEALASVNLYSRQVQAAAKVVETADATIGFLLDTRA